jgi:signal transduction histidine kinase
MYGQMPKPAKDWAEVNLQRGPEAGSLGQAMITVVAGHVTGRFREHDQRGPEPSSVDPAPAAALAALCRDDEVRVGVAVLDDHPALVALSPVLHSDKSGPARGYLMNLAYFTPEILKRFDLHGFTLQVATTPHPAAGPLTGGSVSEPVITRVDNRVHVDVDLAVADGVLHLVLNLDQPTAGAWNGRMLIGMAGLGVAVVASAIGSLLGWWWLRPITRLAAVCRRGSQQGTRIRLPTASGLIEADALANEINRLLEADERVNQRLAESLGREAASHAAQRRFLAGLGHELGQPLHRLVAIAQQAEAHGGILPPEDIERLRASAAAIEARLQEILGWSPDDRDGSVLGLEQPIADYLDALADQLRPLAHQRGLTLTVDAPDRIIRIPGRLLSPVLVNLVANALRATATGGVAIRAEVSAEQLVLTITDTGPGLPPALAERLVHACIEGEIPPGAPGFGLGLTLVLANLRTLGGRLELAHNSPEGAVFIVRLPVA